MKCSTVGSRRAIDQNLAGRGAEGFGSQFHGCGLCSLTIAGLDDFVGVPYRIRTGVAAVRGHSEGYFLVRWCPGMSTKLLILIDTLSGIVHGYPLTSPGHSGTLA